ncbi:conserved hypothetical protein [Theileria equi strain WA]|uniref:J domain-containing protein n=1 Tax=Theileria equi strain WA TaxID=1537102 RepID=L1LG01_THEEQ|nr:conserved hypothetical protein [Theileria equi strain WA]EKX74190.1 conserved hypothetical protein [Theileria equi strain WA]|eukprot:XP_004833642.1 conserved hypothetical protein [Theileria equi strain WA]
MWSKRIVRNGMKRKTLDSPTDEDFETPNNVMSESEFLFDIKEGPNLVDEPFAKNMEETTTIDGEDLDFDYKETHNPKNKRASLISHQFLSNFLSDFTDEELAAKRTVETIYNASGSFSYTYRSLDEAFFSRSSNLDSIKPFIKAMVSVADESTLLKIINSKKAPAPSDPSLLLNLELLLLGQFRYMNEKFDYSLMEKECSDWKDLEVILNGLFSSGVAQELRTCFSNIYNISEVYAEDFKKCTKDIKSLITTLKESIETDKKKKLKRTTASFTLGNCLSCIEFIAKIADFLQKIQSVIIKHLMNLPESEGLVSIVGHIQDDIKSNLRDTWGSEKIEEELYDKINSINILIGEDSTLFTTKELINDVEFCKGKFSSIIEAYEENLKKEREQSAEFMRKEKVRRDAINYILDRLEEFNSTNTPMYYKHPFYIVGISPKTCTADLLRRSGRKLKTLLHPDTVHDPELKHKAEVAFKEASLALDQCIDSITIGNSSFFRVGPSPPYLSLIGIDDSPSSSSYTSSPETMEASVTIPPTLLIFPEFTLENRNNNLGTVEITISPTCLNNGSGWQALGKNRFANVYLLRPSHSDKPVALRISPDKVCTIKKVTLPEETRSKIPNVIFDAVQPFIMDSEWKYFIGVQVYSDREASLITWKSIDIKISKGGRSLDQMKKLLRTFENASFINQDLLSGKLKTLRTKSDGEGFIAECIKFAQRWADNN